MVDRAVSDGHIWDVMQGLSLRKDKHAENCCENFGGSRKLEEKWHKNACTNGDVFEFLKDDSTADGKPASTLNSHILRFCQQPTPEMATKLQDRFGRCWWKLSYRVHNSSLRAFLLVPILVFT